jgi:DNA-directed RNA polymerase specialized sigma24 family protein
MPFRGPGSRRKMTVHRNDTSIGVEGTGIPNRPGEPRAVRQKWAVSPECGVVLQKCFQRIAAWQIPPNWSRPDWLDEIKAHGVAAACQALCDYEVERAVPLEAFVYQRVMARVLTRYRQEWGYALRVVSGNAQDDSPAGSKAVLVSVTAFPPFEVDTSPIHGALRDAVASLPAPSRLLIEQLFWHDRTEKDVAESLRIGRRAVNKRKHAILTCLQGALTDRSQNKTRNEIPGSKRD